jgi:MFS family permease
LEAVSWVSLAYLVAFAACLPIFGQLCEMFGRKSLYLVGYAVFVAASALCGLASDLTWLVIFRVMTEMRVSITVFLRAMNGTRDTGERCDDCNGRPDDA